MSNNELDRIQKEFEMKMKELNANHSFNQKMIDLDIDFFLNKMKKSLDNN